MRSLTTILLVFACAIAHHAMVPSSVQSDKHKVVSGGKTYKIKCGSGYGSYGPHDIRSEKRSGEDSKKWVEAWEKGEVYFSNPGQVFGFGWRGCGSQCANRPTRAVRAGATRGHTIRIFEHASGYYLFFGSTVDGVVRTTDALVLELEGGKRIELYPLCDTTVPSDGEAEEKSRKACGLYDLSLEELKALASAPVTDIKQFFVSSGGGSGTKIDVERTDDGREYVEFRRLPAFKYSIQPRAYCMLNAREPSAK